MIAYKDTTFCSSSFICANSGCPRWISQEEALTAELPLSMGSMRQEGCGYEPAEIWDQLEAIVDGDDNSNQEMSNE